jgi:hypothetical protein
MPRGVVILSSKAERGLKRCPFRTRDRLIAKLKSLEDDPPPTNLDLELVETKRPWVRLRQGDWRAVMFPLASAALKAAGFVERRGYLVWAVIDRKELEANARKLPRKPAIPKRPKA